MTMQAPYWQAGAPERRRARAAGLAFAADRRRLRVGLVNMMPDSALAATERQFGALLEMAAPERTVELHLFSLPGVARSPETATRMKGRYRPAAEVERAGLDALIVTGAEPLAADLRDEPFWPGFARLVDWAAETDVPSLWSCLAAHAAVLHLDGIERRPLASKLSGLFASHAAATHPLTDGLPAAWTTPHSRHNDLDEAELAAFGWRTLTRSSEAGLTAFVHETRGAPFLCLQGHPEYEPTSLMLEFKRDLQRFLTGQRPAPPELPQGVFGSRTADRLQALTDAAREEPRPELMACWPFPSELQLAADTWRAPAARLYRNWLEAGSADAASRMRPSRRPFGAPQDDDGWRAAQRQSSC